MVLNIFERFMWNLNRQNCNLNSSTHHARNSNVCKSCAKYTSEVAIIINQSVKNKTQKKLYFRFHISTDNHNNNFCSTHALAAARINTKHFSEKPSVWFYLHTVNAIVFNMNFKVMLGLFALLTLMCTTEAAVSLSMPSTNKGDFIFNGIVNLFQFHILNFPHSLADYPGQCWDDYDKVAYPVGTNYPKGSCSRLHCSSDFSYELQTWVVLWNKFALPVMWLIDSFCLKLYW